MLPHPAFSSVSTQPMDLLNDVALHQIAVLQQDLFERDVEEAKKRKRTSRARRYHTRPWLAQERRTLRQTDGGAQSRRPTDSPSSTTSGWSLPCLTSWWGKGLRSKSGRSDCIWAAFERLSKISDSIRSAFQLNSFNSGIDSGNNLDAFDVHFGLFETLSGHSNRIQCGLPCRFEHEQNIPASHKNVPNVSECLKCTSIVEECTTNFNSDGIPVHSDSRVTAA